MTTMIILAVALLISVIVNMVLIGILIITRKNLKNSNWQLSWYDRLSR